MFFHQKSEIRPTAQRSLTSGHFQILIIQKANYGVLRPYYDKGCANYTVYKVLE